jgi:predicted ATPase/DNA-binding CsgD family transcriptional regulator
VPQRAPTPQAAGTGIAPVGTTFLAADVGSEVIQEAAAVHAGRAWVDERAGPAAAFPSATAALAGALEVRRLWRRSTTGDKEPRLAVHLDAGIREAGGGYAGPGVSRCHRLAEIGRTGQTLVSAAVVGVAEAPAGTALHDLGLHRLRDLSPPLRVFELSTGDQRVTGASLRSLDAYPNNLPSRPNAFIGREAELAELHARLVSASVLTIVGPGGSGKTSLAAQLAAWEAGRRPDGVWWVELEDLVDGAHVAVEVAKGLDVLVDPAQGAVDSLLAQLAGKRLLLCLDNCEHVLDAAAELTDGLRRRCPEVTVVVTSREPLGLTGETLWRLGPLPVAEARVLFLSRAGHVDLELTVDENAEAAIASMCSRLDGAPLALELAAAWLPTLTPSQIEAGLDDRFSLLVRSPRDAVPRHASLLASMAWSYNLLEEVDRVVFRRLAVFAGGFDIRAAQEVCGGDGVEPQAVLGAVGHLVDKSLVLSHDAGAEGRYRLLETIREYAANRLVAAGERVAVADRHLAYLLDWVRGLAPELERDKDTWRTQLAREHENLGAAIKHGLEADDPTRGRQLAAELPWMWHLHRQGREGMSILRRAIARAPGERSELQARLLAGVALVADTAGPLDVEVDAARSAGELAAEVADDRLLALCKQLEAVGRLYTDLDGAYETSLEAEQIAERAGEHFVADAGRALRGIVLHLRDEHAQAEPLLADAAERLGARGDRGVASTALAFLSGSALLTGDIELARRRAELSIATAAPLADHLRIGMGCSALALALGVGGDVAAGRAALEPIRPLVASPGGARFLPEVNRALGLLDLWAGEPERAIDWLEAESESTDGGRPTYLAIRTLPALASAQRACGRSAEAEATAARAVELARERGMPSAHADALAEQARLCPEDAPEAALALQHEALAIRVDRGLRLGVIESLEDLVALETGTAEQDVRLLAAAYAARAALSLAVQPAAQTDRAALEKKLRAELGNGFDAVWRDGAALSLEDAAHYARRGRGSRRGSARGWGSLTTTEVEVVRLAVGGLTNPEIGARLFMSRSTVKTHLSHVYAKLDVANRTELAAFAAPHLDPDSSN